MRELRLEDVSRPSFDSYGVSYRKVTKFMSLHVTTGHYSNTRHSQACAEFFRGMWMEELKVNI